MQDKDLKIAVIGKSAAGKSAFIKSFSKSAELIDSEGIAQTTRTYAEYKFRVAKPEIQPKVFAKILSKKDFLEKRIEQAVLNIRQKLKLDGLSVIELRSKLDKTQIYVKALKDSILHTKDFFDINEFDFLSKIEKRNWCLSRRISRIFYYKNPGV